MKLLLIFALASFTAGDDVVFNTSIDPKNPLLAFSCNLFENYIKSSEESDPNVKALQDLIKEKKLWNFRCISGEGLTYGEFVKQERPETVSHMAYVYVYFYNDDVKEDPPSSCFEVMKKVTVSRSSYFECFSEKEGTTKSLEDRVRELLNPLVEKAYAAVNGAHNELTDKAVSTEDVYDLLKKVSSTGGDDLKMQLGTILRNKEIEGEDPITTFNYKIEEEDGIYFYFRFDKTPYVLWKGLVYYASPEYLKLEIYSIYQTHELFIQRVINFEDKQTKMDALFEKYKLDIVSIFNKVPSSDAEKSAGDLPVAFKDYALKNVLSFPVLVGLLEWSLTEAPTYQYKKLELEPGEGDNAESMEPKNYFFLLDEERFKTVKSLGTIYHNIPIHSVPRPKISSNDFKISMQKVMNEYLKRFYNKYELAFGISKLHRKLFVRIYNFEDESYKSFLVQFITMYFISEFLIPYSAFNEVRTNINAVVKEVNDHYTEVVAHIEGVLAKPEIITPEMVFELIKKLVETHHLQMCLEVDPSAPAGEEKDIFVRYRAIRKFQVGHHLQPVEPISKEECAKKNKVALSFKKFKIDDKNGYIIELFENERETEEGQTEKALNTQYKFYDKYPYKYLPVLEKYLNSLFSHYKEGKYKREENKTDFGKIFGEQRKDFADDMKKWEEARKNDG